MYFNSLFLLIGFFLFSCNTPCVRLNEVVTSNKTKHDEYGDTPDWIELFNSTDDTVNLKGYALSDDIQEPRKWVFEDGLIPPNGFFTVFASGKDIRQFRTDTVSYLHTNFKLSSKGESIYLSNPQVEELDKVNVPFLTKGYSYARIEGSRSWAIVDIVTFNSINRGNHIEGFCHKEVVFSKKAGFYKSGTKLELSGGAEIRYTTDGSLPNLNSPLYTDVITLDSTLVVKAGCFDDDQIPVVVAVNTYFVDYSTKLPVWSLSLPSGAFFDPDTGIYVLGKNYEKVKPYYGANVWKNWERLVTVEFFEEDGQRQFFEDCGVKIFGNWSRINRKKSLSLHFRKKYGSGKLHYPLFPKYPDLKSFNSLILRDSGNDEPYLLFRDGFHAELMKDASFETQKYRPSVVFINGEYWGIHNIRERVKADFFEENYGIPKEDIDMIASYYEKESGETAAFELFMDDVQNDKLSYDEITKVIDIKSYIDYYAFEIYIANKDWPANNIKYWRQRSVNGKWRWFLYDTDFSTSLYNNARTKVSYNSFSYAIKYEPGVTGPITTASTLLLRKLIKEPEFVKAFVSRYCDLINTTWKPDHVLCELNEKILNKIKEEVVVDRLRWNRSQDLWNTYLEEYIAFWKQRPIYAREHLNNILHLGNEFKIVVANKGVEAGYVSINTAVVKEEEWQGVYFSGIPVRIEAHAYPGYRFKKWNSSLLTIRNNNNSLIESLRLNQDVSIRPVFTKVLL